MPDRLSIFVPSYILSNSSFSILLFTTKLSKLIRYK